jgi:hypothetical protein
LKLIKLFPCWQKKRKKGAVEIVFVAYLTGQGAAPNVE